MQIFFWNFRFKIQYKKNLIVYYFYIDISKHKKQQRSKMSQGEWNNHQIENNHPSFENPPQTTQIQSDYVRPSLEAVPPPTKPLESRPGYRGSWQADIDENHLDQARTFFRRYKRVITSMNNRRDLQQLYDDTFSSWSKPGDNHDFSRTLFALALGMKVLRVISGGTLHWNERRDEHRHRDERISQNDDHDRFYDRFQTGREYRRDHDNRRELPRRDDRRQEDRQHRQPHQPRQETNLAEIVENQQKMIEALMSKVMN